MERKAPEDNPRERVAVGEPGTKPAKSKSRSRDKDLLSVKRRCVSTACVACRRRKSKCDGNTPSCAACSSVYGTECVYDPNSDHRRKGVYKKDIDNLKTRNSTLQTLIQGILNYPEGEVLDLVKQIRSCESLDDVAEKMLAKEGAGEDSTDQEVSVADGGNIIPKFESELSGKMGQLRLQGGAIQFLGGTSNLIFLDTSELDEIEIPIAGPEQAYARQEDAITSWSTVTKDAELVVHLINMYFTWHYTYFTTLSKTLFFKDFLRGASPSDSRRAHEYCTPLLVNAMLALGCHFTQWPAARADPNDSATAGDHFFKEAKRLLLANDEHECPRLPTVQALALMSVREAGCGREAKGWVYSGMSFRMACDLGLDVDSGNASLDEEEIDARRVTFWGCFLFDKCWSNYLGRPPQLPLANITVPKFEVFPQEDAELWSPWSDQGIGRENVQPSRTRAVALQISSLCEISSDLIMAFYHPTHREKPLGKQAQLKKLSDLHTRLEAWRKALPKEMEAREGQLPSILVMHMFYQLLFIHLFRPFLRYTQTNSPLPANVSPRKHCTHAAGMISKLLRLYKRTHGLMQICNIAVYIAHSACTIHILNLPDKDAKRDITHGVRQLEEIAESWLCARRTLTILSTQVRKWQIELPEDAANVLARTDALYGGMKGDHNSPGSDLPSPTRIVAQKLPTSMFVANQYIAHPLITPQSTNIPLTQPTTIATMTNTFSDAPDGFPFTAAVSNPAITATTATTNNIPSMSNPKPTKQSHALSDAQRQAWMQNRLARTLTPSSQAHPSMLFGGVDTLFEDSRDWWLRDQSAIFDGWEKSIHEQPNGGAGVTSTSHTMRHNSAPDGSNGSDPIGMASVSTMGMGHGHGAIHGNGTAGVNGMNSGMGSMNEALSGNANGGRTAPAGRGNAAASIGHGLDFLDDFEPGGRFDYSGGGRGGNMY